MGRFFWAVLLWTSCLLPFQETWAEIRICGSSTITPIVKAAVAPFSTHSGASVSVRGGGSGEGIAGTLTSRCDLGMVSRALHREESAKLEPHLIGYDGIALIINSAIPVTELRSEQIVSIYSGTIRNWEEVGGPDSEIFVVAKQVGRSTRELFDGFFKIPHLSEAALLVGSNTEAIVMVASDPSAIGYVSIGTAEHAVQQGLSLRLLPLEGVAPSTANVASGMYPLSRELNLVTSPERSALAIGFVEFMAGAEGQALVERHSFVPRGQMKR